MGNNLKILITTSPGLEQELQKELLELCGKTASFRPQGPLELDVDLQELCLILAGSFLASRVLYPVAEFHAWEEEVLFKEIYAIDWQNFFDKSHKGMDTFRIDAHGRTLQKWKDNNKDSNDVTDVIKKLFTFNSG